MRKCLLVIARLVVWAHAEGPSYHDRLLKAVLQVAIVCRDIQATSRRWADLLGVDPPQIHLTKPGRKVKAMYRGRPTSGQATLAFIKLGQATLELIEPVGGDTGWRQFLDERGEGVQHIAFQVTDLGRTVKGFEESGIPVLHRGRYDDDSGSYVYVDSAKALGATLELLHSDRGKK